MEIGFIGLGRMGGAMVPRLLAHGFSVCVFHPDIRRTTGLQGLGAQVAADVTELCRGRTLIISMLPSDSALESVALGPQGLAQSMEPGSIHMVSGTHGVRAIEAVAAAHARHEQILVSCPVLGRPERAAEGKLGLIAAGPAAAIDAVGEVLAVLGEKVFRPGENPLSAAAIKIANNFVLGCAIEAMGEGMALARRYGVEPLLFHEVLSQGLFNCIAYQGYGDVIAREDWGRVGATASIGLKDAHLAFEAAEKVNVPLPSGNVWRDHLLSACGRGEAALDWSVMARTQFRNSGLD